MPHQGNLQITTMASVLPRVMPALRMGRSLTEVRDDAGSVEGADDAGRTYKRDIQRSPPGLFLLVSGRWLQMLEELQWLCVLRLLLLCSMFPFSIIWELNVFWLSIAAGLATAEVPLD